MLRCACVKSWKIIWPLTFAKLFEMTWNHSSTHVSFSFFFAESDVVQRPQWTSERTGRSHDGVSRGVHLPEQAPPTSSLTAPAVCLLLHPAAHLCPLRRNQWKWNALATFHYQNCRRWSWLHDDVSAVVGLKLWCSVIGRCDLWRKSEGLRNDVLTFSEVCWFLLIFPAIDKRRQELKHGRNRFLCCARRCRWCWAFVTAARWLRNVNRLRGCFQRAETKGGENKSRRFITRQFNFRAAIHYALEVDLAACCGGFCRPSHLFGLSEASRRTKENKPN